MVLDEEYFQLLTLLRALDERLSRLKKEIVFVLHALVEDTAGLEAFLEESLRSVFSKAQLSPLSARTSSTWGFETASALLSALLATFSALLAPADGSPAMDSANDEFSVAEWGAGPGVWSFRAARLWYYWSKHIKFVNAWAVIFEEKANIIRAVVRVVLQAFPSVAGQDNDVAFQRRRADFLTQELIESFFFGGAEEERSSLRRSSENDTSGTPTRTHRGDDLRRRHPEHPPSPAFSLLKAKILDSKTPTNCHVLMVEPMDVRLLFRHVFDAEVWRYCRGVQIRDGLIGSGEKLRKLNVVVFDREEEVMPRWSVGERSEDDIQQAGVEEIVLNTHVPYDTFAFLGDQFEVKRKLYLKGRGTEAYNVSTGVGLLPVAQDNIAMQEDDPRTAPDGAVVPNGVGVTPPSEQESSRVAAASSQTDEDGRQRIWIARENASSIYDWFETEVRQNFRAEEQTSTESPPRAAEGSEPSSNPATALASALATDLTRRIRSTGTSTSSSSAGAHYIDLVDIDIQGFEVQAVQRFRDSFAKKVRRVHVGTHSRFQHVVSRRSLRGAGAGFWIEQDFPMGGVGTVEGVGTVAFRDGILSFVNDKVGGRLEDE